MSLFDPDPDLPFWMNTIPLAADLAEASAEQRQLWTELNAHIAYVHTSWSNMEFMLSFLFAAILKIKVAPAKVILSTLTSNKTKRDLIQNCALLLLASDARVSDVERILRRVAKVASKRNFLAHGIGGYHQKYPDRITVSGLSPDLNPALSHYISYSLEDLQEIRQTLDFLAGDIQALVPTIWKSKRRALPETPLQRPPHDMGFAENHRRPHREKQQAQHPPSQKKPRPKKLSSAQKRALREKGEGN